MAPIPKKHALGCAGPGKIIAHKRRRWCIVQPTLDQLIEVQSLQPQKGKNPLKRGSLVLELEPMTARLRGNADLQPYRHS